MKLIIKDSYESLSTAAAGILLAEMARDKRVNMAITAGNSPKGAYEITIREMKAAPGDFANVHYYNFDEVPVKGEPKGVTMRDLDTLFFIPAEIPAARIHPLTCENYTSRDEEIANAGGLDLMFLGLGGDGHFCGNMPHGTRFEEQTYRMYIKKEYAWYKTIEDLGIPEIPEYFVTMGAVSIMRVRRLVMIVNGKGKAQTVKRFFESPVDTAFPASILKLHPDFTVLMDKDAASAL
jgi:6-phosphogluconolactonase/glucosamine-6-phosphate isomerase/deaminase